MIVSVVSWDAHNINDGTNYESWFPLENRQAGPYADPVYIGRAENWPKLGTTLPQPFVLMLSISIKKSTLTDGWDELNSWFDVTNATPLKLIAKDESNAQWFVMATCIRISHENAVEALVSLAVDDDAHWRKETESSVAWAVTSSGDTEVVTPVGDKPALPTLAITPTGARTGGYAYRKWLPVYNPTVASLRTYGLDLTNGGLDTATLVTGGKMQADGDDWVAQVNGVLDNRWLADMNTAASKLWVVLDFQPGRSFTIQSAIADSGEVTSITLQNTAANITAITKMPAAGTFVIDTGATLEAFTYTGKNNTKRKFTGVTRATHDTNMSAHTAGATGRWIEHDIWMLYGNTGATAPVVDDTSKPIFNLSSSTNTSWVYTEFADGAGLRAGSWKPAVLQTYGKQSVTYTGSHGAEADPATEMGMSMLAFQKSGRWQAETATMAWTLWNPVGFTHVTSAGDKYRYSTSWATAAKLQYSTDGSTWTQVWNEAAPAAAQTWTAWTHAASDLGGTRKWLRFLLKGSLSATADNQVSMEVQGVTLTLDSTRVPQFMTNPGEQSNYYLDCVITNETSGDSLSLKMPMSINSTVTVNCKEKTVVYEDGTDVFPAISFNTVRAGWLDLAPGGNTLKFEDTGTGNATITVTWRDRRAF